MGIIKHVKDLVQGKTTLGKRRSPRWPKVRAEHLKNNPTCALCGGQKKLEVHHVVPFHIDATLELEPTNLITLCESKKGGVNCHLFIGHAGSYRRQNIYVRADVGMLQMRILEAKEKEKPRLQKPEEEPEE